MFGSYSHKAKHKIHMSAMWLFHILQKQKERKSKDTLTNFCTFERYITTQNVRILQ
jgi:hypothetical protein